MVILRTLLLSGRDADDVEVQLELVLLQLWSSKDPDILQTELLALDAKSWRRLGLLLFASNDSLVQALVAVLERAASHRDKSDSHERVLRRVWQTQWREHLREKVKDCHARLERQRSGVEERGRTEDLIATRLLQILAASVRAALISSQCDDERLKEEKSFVVDAPAVMEIVELLLSLSTAVESTPDIARVAAVELQSMFSLDPHTLSGLITTHICRSTAMQHYVSRLRGDDCTPAIESTTAPMKQLYFLNVNSSAGETLADQHQCDLAFLELLIAAAMAARPDANTKLSGARSAVLDDTEAMLQICTLGITNSSLQHGSLRLLCSLLVLDDASASALSSAVRLSGILISISWLLGHADSNIAAMAATTLEVIIRHSPPSDILRAVIEQGCVLIYRALLSACSGANRSPAQAAVAASCRSLLNWVTDEVAWQTGVVAASVQSILSSTNVLLQKNIVLTLQVLAQRNPAICESLEEQEFLANALVMAIQADEEASLAASLLSASLSCCDKCSTLKIENSRVDDGSKNEQDKVEQVDDAGEQDQIIHIRCADGEIVQASDRVLHEHTNLLRGLEIDRSEDSVAVTTKLDKFRASSVQLFVDLLPKTQQEAVAVLTKLHRVPILQELLRLANASGSVKCWHVTTSAMSRIMSADNWLEIFQFASAEVRHPTLVLRCTRFALQLHSALALCSDERPVPHPEENNTTSNDPVERKRANLATALKTAAIQIAQELFVG